MSQSGSALSEPRRILWRVVKRPELADILATGQFRNPVGIERKYFSETADGAVRYAMLAYRVWVDEGPYTLVVASIPSRLITPEMRVSVDVRIAAVVIPTALLPAFGRPTVLASVPLPWSS